MYTMLRQFYQDTSVIETSLKEKQNELQIKENTNIVITEQQAQKELEKKVRLDYKKGKKTLYIHFNPRS